MVRRVCSGRARRVSDNCPMRVDSPNATRQAGFTLLELMIVAELRWLILCTARVQAVRKEARAHLCKIWPLQERLLAQARVLRVSLGDRQARGGQRGD